MANRKKKNSNTMSRGKRELKESYYFEINKKKKDMERRENRRRKF